MEEEGGVYVIFFLGEKKFVDLYGSFDWLRFFLVVSLMFYWIFFVWLINYFCLENLIRYWLFLKVDLKGIYFWFEFDVFYKRGLIMIIFRFLCYVVGICEVMKWN